MILAFFLNYMATIVLFTKICSEESIYAMLSRQKLHNFLLVSCCILHKILSLSMLFIYINHV